MNFLSRLIPFSIFLFIAGLMVWSLITGRSLPNLMSDRVNYPLPAFTLAAMNAQAQTITHESLKGQISLVVFFASWCPACHAQMPVLQNLAVKGLKIYGIAWRDDPEKLAALLAREPGSYSWVGIDGGGHVAISFGISGVPENFLIDREGRVRYRFMGALTPQEVEDRLGPLIRRLSATGS